MTTPTPEGVLCQWFALCANTATTVRAHSILEVVPICGRCDEVVAKVEQKTRRA
jgi:hypothetical protein